MDAGWQNSAHPTSIGNDPATPYDEAALLTRQPDGTIQYDGNEHANWAGGDGPDKIHSGGGIDTVRGGDGNDDLEGGGDGDTLIGGNGDDILTDIFGPDVFKGGDGNDAIQSGPGLDLIQPGRGHDFSVGGSDGTITFGAEGNDLIFGGDGADEIHGDDGDDWLEGGEQPDKVEGDSGLVILLGVDVNTPGHDVLNGDGGDDRLFAEGGDDIMFQGPGFDQFLGQLGFDWVTHYRDPLPAESDFENNALVIPPPGAIFDQFTFVEGLSGWDQDDDLRGDSPLPAELIGNELTAEGIARIDGLSALLGGATSFTDGNIILGGAGNDMIEGRGGNDFIDGDAWLKVQLSAGGQLHDSMLELEADVFARLLNPGDISIVRSIVPGAPGLDADTAVFSGPRADYDITFGATETDPTIVVHARNLIAADDGTDTLVNIEFLEFTDQTIPVPTNPVDTTDTAAPTWSGGVVTVSNASTNALDLSWSGATDDVGVVDYNVYQDGAIIQTGVVGTSTTVTGLDPEMTYTFTVEALDASPNESTDGPSVDGSTIAVASEFFFSTSGDATVPGVVGTPDDANIYTWTGSGYSMVHEAVATLGLDPAADVDGLTVVAPDHFFVSFTTTATAVPGLVDPVQGEDIVEFNAGTWSLFLDGTAEGVASIDGVHVDGSDVYFSTVAPTTVPGVGGVADDADVYLWDGSAFSRVWDATAALPGGGGLASAADVDGLTVVAPEHLYLSFQSTVVIPGLGTVQGEDIVEFNAGTWSLFFDGTSNGLTAADSDVDAIHTGPILTPPDVVAPLVAVSSPSNWSTVAAPVSVAGSATDDVGVTQVVLEIYDRDTSLWWSGAAWQAGRTSVDAVLGAGTTSRTWSYDFDPAAPASQPYWVTVRSRDAGGNASGYTFTNFAIGDMAPPSVAVSSPSNWSTVAAPVSVAGSATDDVGVTQVVLEIYDRDTSLWWSGAAWQAGRTSVDAVLGAGTTSRTWSYDFDPAAPASQPYWVTVRSRDAGGNASGYTFTNFAIGDMAPPSVAVSSPSNWSTVAAPVSVAGSATDDVGVTQVVLEIYDRDTSLWWSGAAWQAGRTSVDAVLGAGTTSRTWSYDFDPAAPASQPYWVTVRSRDAGGNASGYTFTNFAISVP